MSGYRVVTVYPLAESGELVSSTFTSIDAALGFARDLIEDGDAVLRIEDRDGEVVRTREEVEAWCADAAANTKEPRTMKERPADRFMAGLRDAIAYARGETNGCVVHTPESVIARRKARHRELAGLRVVRGDDAAGR